MNRPSPSDLRVLFEETPTALVLLDRDSRITVTNPRTRSLFGYGAGALEGRDVEVLVPDGLRRTHESHRAAVGEEPRRRPVGVGLELRGRHKDGTLIPLEISLSPVDLEGGFRVLAAIRDVSERRELRSWGSLAVEAAEEERLRIARELHDDLAQRLVALQVHAKVARDAPADRANDLLDGLSAELRECSELVRRLIQGLRPPALADLDLEAVLRSDLRQRLDPVPIDLELEMEGPEEPVGERLQLCLYRIAQEAVNNAVRHADPTEIAVRLREDGGGVIELSVLDDGCGFDTDRVAGTGDRYGLVGMRERAGAVGGRLAVESRPGRGTLVRARVPRRAADTPGTPTRPPTRPGDG